MLHGCVDGGGSSEAVHEEGVGCWLQCMKRECLGVRIKAAEKVLKNLDQVISNLYSLLSLQGFQDGELGEVVLVFLIGKLSGSDSSVSDMMASGFRILLISLSIPSKLLTPCMARQEVTIILGALLLPAAKHHNIGIGHVIDNPLLHVAGLEDHSPLVIALVVAFSDEIVLVIKVFSETGN